METQFGKYGVQTDFYFSVYKQSDGWDTGYASSSDWTPASGDAMISKDGGNVASTTNAPTAIGGTGSVSWKVTLTATEMQAAMIVLQIVDPEDLIVDKTIVIHTHGHASAKIREDLTDMNFNADALLNRDMSAVTVTNARSPINALRSLRNAWTVIGTTWTIYEEDDTTVAWTSELSTDGDASAVTGSNPA